MAKVLNDEGSWEAINFIVSAAKKFVVLISPFIGSKDILSLISQRDNDNVYVQLFTYPPEKQNEKYRANVEDTIKALNNLENVIVRYNSNEFHTKCYFNEEYMLISSMNLSHYNSNCEMSVLLSKEWDKGLFEDALRYVNDICRLFGMNEEDLSNIENHKLGYCIRCGEKIDFDMTSPYCNNCAFDWYFAGGWGGYIENYCHCCGKEHSSSLFRPLHKSCYYKLKTK